MLVVCTSVVSMAAYEAVSQEKASVLFVDDDFSAESVFILAPAPDLELVYSVENIIPQQSIYLSIDYNPIKTGRADKKWVRQNKPGSFGHVASNKSLLARGSLEPPSY